MTKAELKLLSDEELAAKREELASQFQAATAGAGRPERRELDTQLARVKWEIQRRKREEGGAQ